MKEIENKSKKGIFKKIFVKICRIFGFEIIDQSNFSIPTMEKDISDNLSTLGKKSINLPLGEVKITRKVKSLDIIFRTCMAVEMLTQNKKRIFAKEKNEYTLRSINSVIKSYLHSESLKNIDVNFKIIDHKSNAEDLKKIEELFKNYKINYELIHLEISQFEKEINKINDEKKPVTANQISNMSNIHQSLLVSRGSKDLIYFIEDDYLHTLDCLEEMIFTYERVASQIEDELFICSTDYPYLYNKFENTKILLGNNYHWRKVDETLCSFMTSKSMVNKYWKELLSMCKHEHYPFEKPLHNIFKKELCISPMPSLSIHCTNINSIYGLSPNIDWKNIWDKNEIKN